MKKIVRATIERRIYTKTVEWFAYKYFPSKDEYKRYSRGQRTFKLEMVCSPMFLWGRDDPDAWTCRIFVLKDNMAADHEEDDQEWADRCTHVETKEDTDGGPDCTEDYRKAKAREDGDGIDIPQNTFWDRAADTFIETKIDHTMSHAYDVAIELAYRKANPDIYPDDWECCGMENAYDETPVID